MLPCTYSIHLGVCQRAGRVYLALYGTEFERPMVDLQSLMQGKIKMDTPHLLAVY